MKKRVISISLAFIMVAALSIQSLACSFDRSQTITHVRADKVCQDGSTDGGADPPSTLYVSTMWADKIHSGILNLKSSTQIKYQEDRFPGTPYPVIYTYTYSCFYSGTVSSSICKSNVRPN